jgi:hypothetical protein
MPAQYQEPKVKIIFSGLFLFCLDPAKPDATEYERAEFGILECPDHTLVFDILKITTDLKTKLEKSELVRHELISGKNSGQDIWITAYSADGEPADGLRKRLTPNFIPDASFDPLANPDDPRTEDFRWIVDLEGDKFQRQQLVVQPNGRKPKLLKPKIHLNAGTIYTAKLTDELFRVEALNDKKFNESANRDLGAIAYQIGVDIECSKLHLSNFNPARSTEQHESLKELEITEDVRYVITIDNLCPTPPNGGNNSDFVFFFDAVTQADKSSKKFDLRRIIRNQSDTGAANFVEDAHEIPCFGGLLGQTFSL